MGQVARVGGGIGDPESEMRALRQQINEILLVLDDHVEFGEPGNALDPEYTSPAKLAGDMSVAGAHNGTVSNINGSWVEIALETYGLTEVTCTHNLYLNTPEYVVPVTGQPNCRWLFFGAMHDGTGADPVITTTRIGVDIAFLGGTVTANSIDLRMNLRIEGSTLTVDETHPVLVTLFFTKATRGE